MCRRHFFTLMETSLLPVLTAKENITLPMDLDGQKVDYERVSFLKEMEYNEQVVLI